MLRLVSLFYCNFVYSKIFDGLCYWKTSTCIFQINVMFFSNFLALWMENCKKTSKKHFQLISTDHTTTAVNNLIAISVQRYTMRITLTIVCWFMDDMKYLHEWWFLFFLRLVSIQFNFQFLKVASLAQHTSTRFSLMQSIDEATFLFLCRSIIRSNFEF